MAESVRSEEERRRDEQRVRYVYAGFGVGVALVAAVLVLRAVYAPYEFVEYSAVPEQACPAENITVEVDRRLEPRSGFGVSRVEAHDVRWVSVDGSHPDISAIVPEDGFVERRLTTIAPSVPGRWSLRADVEVFGRALIIPASQQLSVGSRDILEVVEPRECTNAEEVTQ